MIELDEVLRLARQFLAGAVPGPAALDVDVSNARRIGPDWIVPWNSVEYLRTRDVVDLLLGAVPLRVGADGSVDFQAEEAE